MKIICIFEIANQGLYSVKYPANEQDELNRLFDLWQDVEFLEDFFETNKSDLQIEFWNNISVETAVLRTINDVNGIMDELLEIYEGNESKTLNNLFKPLDNIEYRITDLQKSKARSYRLYQNSWLRLYAIKMNDNYYVITGGSIKLTKTMNERKHLQKEVTKLNACRDFLRSKGIFDEDGLKEFVDNEV